MIEVEVAALLTAWRLTGYPNTGPIFDELSERAKTSEFTFLPDDLPETHTSHMGQSADDLNQGDLGDSLESELGPERRDQAGGDSSEGGEVSAAPETERRTRRSPEKRQTPSLRSRRRQVVRQEDHPFLVQLSKTGVALEGHASKAGISKMRLHELIRAKVVAVENTAMRLEGKMSSVRVIRLGTRGRNYLRSHLGAHLYNGNSQQVAHNVRLTEIYWALKPEIRDTWVSEGELIKRWKSERTYVKGEAVDAAVKVDGRWHAIEVAVGYAERDLKMKRAAIARHFGGHGTIIRKG